MVNLLNMSVKGISDDIVIVSFLKILICSVSVRMLSVEHQ